MRPCTPPECNSIPKLRQASSQGGSRIACEAVHGSANACACASLPFPPVQPGNFGCRLKERRSVTDPPLNAPTGFRTGAAVAVSCSRRLEAWNNLVEVESGRTRERDEIVENRSRDSLDAMPELSDECVCRLRIVSRKDSGCDYHFTSSIGLGNQQKRGGSLSPPSLGGEKRSKTAFPIPNLASTSSL